MLPSIQIHEYSIHTPATVNFSLAATPLEPEGQNPRAVVQINGVTGIKKEFYLRLAQYLAECGFVVVVYDCRGIGGSRPNSLKGFNASLRMRIYLAVLRWNGLSGVRINSICPHFSAGLLIANIFTIFAFL